MTRFMNSLAAAVVAGAALLASADAVQAQTVRVNYSVPEEMETIGMSNGLNANVTLNPHSDFWDLTPGVSETVLLSGGSVQLFQGHNASGSGTLTRALTASIGSGTPDTETISQQVDIFTEQDIFENTADVFLRTGSPVVLDLGGYELTVTPRATGVTGQTSTNITINNSADFLLTVVPEPTSGLLILAGAGLLMARRRA